MRPDSIFQPYRSGAVFQTDRQRVIVTDAWVFGAISTLLPLLDGTRSLLEIVSQVSPELTFNVKDILLLLLEAGFLEDWAGERCHEMPQEDERDCYRWTIDFLSSVAPNPMRSFKQIRNSRVVVIGAGRPLDSCVAGLTRLGIGVVRSVQIQNSRSPFEELRIVRSCAAKNGMEAAESASGDSDEIELSQANLACFCCEQTSMVDLMTVSRACLLENVPFLPAIAAGAVTFLGPASKRRDSTCLACGLIRIVDVVPMPGRRMLNDFCLHGISAPAEAEAAASIGRALAFEAFKILAGGVRIETDEHIVVTTYQNGSPLVVRIHHPLGSCLTECEPFSQQAGCRTCLGKFI
jgi:hypothetical protein